MESTFEGTGVALVTPFKHDYTIDFEALQKVLLHVDNDVDYLVVCGTTGEAPTLSTDEKIKLITFISDHSERPIMFGYGGNNTQQLIDEMNRYPWESISGILSITPYYNKPSQDGIIRHYEELAEASPVPMVLYNVPGRTGTNINAETAIHLSQHQKIIGIKEASGNFQQAFKIFTSTDDSFILISGDDMLTLPLISFGARGVISVLANAIPGTFSGIFKYVLKGEWENARNEARKILQLNDDMYAEGSPSGIKQLMSYMNLCTNVVRRPLIEVSDQLAGTIFENWQKIKGN